jgi:transcriptional repressor NrdR
VRCPFCTHEASQVKDSRPSEDGASIRRRRQCEACGARFTTFERVQLRDLIVVKKAGEREPFERAKLERSVALACRKRDIPADRIERLITSIQRQLETRGDEVTTTQIGEAVMDGLKALDHVAYIRFASVYKDFSEPGDFAEIAGAVGDGGTGPDHARPVRVEPASSEAEKRRRDTGRDTAG